MDVKAKIEEIVAKIKSNPNLMSDFTSNPVKTVESIIGIDIPDGIEDQIVAGVKSALSGITGGKKDDAASGGNLLENAVDSVKGLFGGN
ncbi:MAG: hypothetical protein ILP10_04690 [Lachnospiraceae bacterium]|nr:hypothetical protein [Lachnospiraceae bacterium]